MRKFIKTVIVVLLVTLLVFSVCACKKESDNTSSGSLYATDESSPVSSESINEKSKTTTNESTTSSAPSKNTSNSKVEQSTTNANGNKAASSNVSSTEKIASLTITTQPKDVTASAGSKVTFSVAVSGGKAPYAYTWQRNSQGRWENITDSADAWSYGDDTLFVMAYQNTWMVNESIRCVVKDAEGNSVTSNSVKVILAEPLAITAQPKDTTVSAGSKVELSVGVSGGKAPYTYTWQSNSQGRWENITDSADAWSYGDDTLFVMAYQNTWMVNESIRCVVKDANGNSVTSDSVRVRIG